MLLQSHRIELNHVVVLQFQERLLDFERDDLPRLTTHWDVRDASLLNQRFIMKETSIEANLIPEENDELARQPLSNFLLGLTVGVSVAHFELHCDLLRFLRVVITPNLHVFIIDTFEFFLPCYNFV